MSEISSSSTVDITFVQNEKLGFENLVAAHTFTLGFGNDYDPSTRRFTQVVDQTFGLGEIIGRAIKLPDA